MTTPPSLVLFKGRHFDQEIIVLCVRWYLSFKLSSRDLVRMMAERGVVYSRTAQVRSQRRSLVFLFPDQHGEDHTDDFPDDPPKLTSHAYILASLYIGANSLHYCQRTIASGNAIRRPAETNGVGLEIRYPVRR